jgi:PAS domain S-box-containing protein
MMWPYLIYIFTLFLIATTTFILAATLYRQGMHSRRKPASFLLGAAGIWTLGNAFQLLNANLESQIFWAKFQFIGIEAIPFAWLLLVLHETGRKRWLKPRFYALLGLEPVLMLALIWTNDSHHLVWSNPRLVETGPFTTLEMNFQALMWLQIVYSYAVIVAGLFLFLAYLLKASNLYRRQILALFIAGLIPLVANVLFIFDVGVLGSLDMTPVFFLLSVVVLSWKLRRYWLFDLKRTARTTLLGQMNDGVFLLDERERIVDANQKICQILDRSAMQLIGREAQEIIPDWEILWNGASRFSPASRETAIINEERLYRYFELRASPIKDQTGEFTGRLIIWRDITKQKLTEHALKASEKIYRQSVERSPNPIFSIDREGHILSWNQACERIFQHGQEIVGKKYSPILLDETSAKDTQTLLREVFRHKRSFSDLDLNFKSSTGDVRYTLSRLYPLIDQDGAVKAVVFANTDITELRRTETALRRQLEELTVLHQVATACAQSNHEDELIERITDILGETLYPQNFGVLLIKESTGKLGFHPSYRGLPDKYKPLELSPGEGVTGKVVETGAPLLVSDVRDNNDYVHFYFNTRSELCVPIKIGGRTIGVINAESDQSAAYSEEDQRLLATLAGQLATAIDRLRAEATERQHVQELLTITRISHEITSKLDRQEVLDSIVLHATRISNSDACGVFMTRADGKFYLVATYGVSHEFIQTVNAQGIPAQGSAVGRAISERRPVHISDVQHEPDYAVGHLATLEGIRAILALPMMQGDESVGGIVLWRRQPHHFTLEEEIFLQALAQQSVNAVENARLFEAEREQRKLAEAMREIGTALSASLDLDTVLDRLLDQAARLAPYDAASVLLVEGDQARLARTVGLGPFHLNLNRDRPIIFNIPDTPNLEHLVETQRPLIIADIQDYTQWRHQNLSHHTRSWIGIPVSDQNQVVALFTLDKAEPNFYQPEHAERLSIFAGQAALALQNARLFEEAQARATQMEALNAVVAAAAAATDLQQFLQTTLGRILQALNLEAGGIRIRQQEATQNLPAGFDWHHDTPQGKHAFRAPRILDLSHQNTKSEQEITTGWEQAGIRSGLSAPVLSNGNVLGEIFLITRQPRKWIGDELALVELIGRQLGAVVERLELLEETQRRLKEVTLLSRVITLTATANDMSSALNQLCREVAIFFDTDQAGFALLKPDRSQAEVVAEFRSEGRPSALGLHIPVRDNPSMEYLLNQKRSLAISDALNDPLLASIRGIMLDREVASILLVPIIMGQEVIGTLGLDSLEPRQFTPSDVELMENIARQISQALERLQLFDRISEHANQMAYLALLSENLNRPLTTEEVLQGIGEGALALSEADGAAIFIRSSDDGLTCPWYLELSTTYIQEITNNAQRITGGQWAQQSEPLLIADIDELAPDSILLPMAHKEGYRALGVWPLVYEGRVVAAAACHYEQPTAWSENQRDVMMAFARQAAVALQNAHLFEETRRRAAQQEALSAIIAAAAAAPAVQDLLETVLSLILDALEVQHGGVWVKSYHAVQGLPKDFDQISNRILNKTQPAASRTLAVADWSQMESQVDLTADLLEQEILASLTVPIISEARPIGSLSVASELPRFWSKEEVDLLESTGRQIGGAVERLDLLAKSQEQARQVQQIMDTVPEGVILLNAGQEVLLANPAAREYLANLNNAAESDLVLQYLGEFPVKELLRSNVETTWIEMETLEPPKRFFEIAARPVDAHKENTGWVLVIRDVTQERDNQNRIQIQERLATVGQLAAGIAHDFNNIMAAIAVYADLLLMDNHLAKNERERLSIIKQQINRATSLIRQILDFSRRSVMEQSTLDLLPFIKELDKLLGRVLPENIRLEFDYRPGTYLIRADPTRLQQVFMNLAVNARDAMPEGGSLKFRLDSLVIPPGHRSGYPAGQQELSPGRWIRIMVQDTGIGIPPEVLPHIFDPFFTTKPVGQGTGLGLAQVYGIVKQHNGSINVESQPGMGSTFTIDLPALEIPVQKSTPEDHLEDLWGAGENILVVEDDDVTRQALKSLLEAQNYHALEASNGFQALQVYDQARQHIELVISDIVMPEMGGMTLYRKLKEKWPHLKVLFVTGHPMDLEDQTMLEVGSIPWIAKPFSSRQILGAIKSLLLEPD